MECEAKIVYDTGDRIRSLRGRLDDTHPDFIVIHRQDGSEITIARRFVRTIEKFPAQGARP